MNPPKLFLSEVRVDFHTARRLDLRDAYLWHQRLSEDVFHQALEAQKSLPEAQRQRLFLWRVDRIEHGFRAWVLSQVEPLIPPWGRWRPPKPVNLAFREGRRFAFSLRANPTWKSTPKGEDNRRHVQGKRMPLLEVAELREWIERKARDNGFQLDEAPATGQLLSITKEARDRLTIPEVNPPRAAPSTRKVPNPNPRVWLHSVLFEGVLAVTQPDQFAQAFANGLGSAKGLGFGLLVLLPLPVADSLNTKPETTNS